MEDYNEDADGTVDMTGWACPVSFDTDDDSDAESEKSLPDLVRAENRKLAPWHALAIERRGGTTVGASGKSVDEVVTFLEAQMNGNVSGDDAAQIKLAAEDLRAYYIEAATSQPGPTTSQGLLDWFFGETSAGALLLALQPMLATNDDKRLQGLANFLLIPRTQMHRLTAEETGT